LLSKQLEDKKEKAKRLKAAHENMLLNLLGGEIRDDDLKYQFENCLSKLVSVVLLYHFFLFYAINSEV